MTRIEAVKLLAQDYTEGADLDTLVEFYYEHMEKYLGGLTNEQLIAEYDEWFEPDESITIEEETNENDVSR